VNAPVPAKNNQDEKEDKNDTITTPMNVDLTTKRRHLTHIKNEPLWIT
jgi:hypothetical protein